MKIVKHKFWWICVTLLLPSLIMAPVLLWPHYGLFSDADQVISFPKFFWESPSAGLDRILRPFGDGRYQPFFYLLTVLIYLINPDSALTFYIFQWILFTSTCLIAAWLVFRLSGSVGAAVLSSLLFCFSSSIYESFYTLDKIEPRTTFFSAVLLALIAQKCFRKAGDPNLLLSSLNWFLQIFFGICLIYSKETGIFLMSALFLVWVLLVFRMKDNSGLKKVIQISFFIQLFITASFFILFKLLWNEVDEGRYLNYSITYELVKNNLYYYCQSSPEIILATFYSVYLWVKFIFYPPRAQHLEASVLGLIVSASFLIYFSGILIWRWPLDYFILPVHFFGAILISLAFSGIYSSDVHKHHKILLRGFFALLFLGLVAFAAMRSISGFLIYHQDELKDELAKELSDIKWRNNRFILPFNHPNSAEIGERIKFFVNRRSGGQDFLLFNFWEFDPKVIADISRFDSSVGVPPTQGQLLDASITKGPIIWKFGGGDPKWPKSMWQFGRASNGDILLIPYGKNIPSWVQARGIGMFKGDFQVPSGLNVMEIGRLGHSYGGIEFGWKVLQITNPTNN